MSQLEKTVKDEIKAIGFDLDQTLYPKSQEIDRAIQQYLYQKISEVKRCGIDEAERLFKSLYPEHSGRETMIKLGVPNAAEVVQEALEKADIAPYLKPNTEVQQLLKTLKEKYRHIALITGSGEQNAKDKLKALEIPLEIFEIVIYGDTSKRDGTAYKQWMQKLPHIKPEEFLYIGDRAVTDVYPAQDLGMKTILVNVKEIHKKLKVLQLSALLDLKKIL